MTRRLILRAGAALALMGLVSGCGLFDDEDRLEGERIRIREQRNPDAGQLLGGPVPALPAPVAMADWTQTNGRSNHASGHLAGPSSPTAAWRADAGTGGAITSAPIVTGGRIFTMDAAAQLSAFDAGSGSVVWRTDLAPEGEDGEEGFGGGLAASGGVIYATTGFGEVVAVSASSGEIVWRYRASAPFRAAPSVSGSVVLAVNRENDAVALNVSDGKLVWRVGGVAAAAGLLGGAAPAIQGDLAVIPFTSGEIMGVQLSTGRQVWSAVLGSSRRGQARSSISDVSGDPVIAGRVVVAASQSGRMVAIDGQTGRRGWTRSLGSTGPIWAAGESIFVVSDAAVLMRLAIQSGKTHWQTELPAYEDPEDREDAIAYSGPVVAGGRVFVTDSLGNLHSFDAATGTQGATVSLSDGSTTGPVVAGGRLYVLSNDGTLQAFR